MTFRQATLPSMNSRSPGVLSFFHEAVLVAAAALTYFGVRNLTAGAAPEALENSRRVSQLEEWAHLAWEQRLQEVVIGHDLLLTLFNWVYIWGHWPTIAAVAVVLYRRQPDRYLLLRNAMFLSGAVGFLFFALLPVAPPRLAAVGLVDTVTLHSDAYRALQPPGLTNQYAAFPSLHFGWNLLLGVVVWGSTRNVLLRFLAVAGPAAMAAAVVLTANHYVLDVIGGLVLVLLSFLVARRQLALAVS
jgi:membrane-associated phospholipid phosphatase